jgi:hypothetical protein
MFQDEYENFEPYKKLAEDKKTLQSKAHDFGNAISELIEGM